MSITIRTTVKNTPATWDTIKYKLLFLAAFSGTAGRMFQMAAQEHSDYMYYVRSGHAHMNPLDSTALPPGAISAAFGLLSVGICLANAYSIKKALEPYRTVAATKFPSNDKRL